MPDLLGEVIYWESPKQIETTLFAQILKDASLTAYIPTLGAGTAFSRATQVFNKGRIVRPLKAKEGKRAYQFTAEHANGDGFLHYEKETGVFFNPETHEVSCPDRPELEKDVASEVHKRMSVYESSDITKAIQTIFEKEADLFPLKSRNSFFFVPSRFAPLLDTVSEVVTKIGGSFHRIPVPPTASASLAIRDAISNGMTRTVGDLIKTIEEFDPKTTPKAMEKTAEKIRGLQLKCQAYEDLLAEAKEQVAAKVDEAKKALRKKIEDLALIEV